MLDRKWDWDIAPTGAESTKRSLAQRFARVLAQLKLEYELDLDVVDEAERQLRSLKAREMN